MTFDARDARVRWLTAGESSGASSGAPSAELAARAADDDALSGDVAVSEFLIDPLPAAAPREDARCALPPLAFAMFALRVAAPGCVVLEAGAGGQARSDRRVGAGCWAACAAGGPRAAL